MNNREYREYRLNRYLGNVTHKDLPYPYKVLSFPITTKLSEIQEVLRRGEGSVMKGTVDFPINVYYSENSSNNSLFLELNFSSEAHLFSKEYLDITCVEDKNNAILLQISYTRAPKDEPVKVFIINEFNIPSHVSYYREIRIPIEKLALDLVNIYTHIKSNIVTIEIPFKQVEQKENSFKINI